MDDVIVNGRLLSGQQALVPVQDRGFRYGDGVYETIAVLGGVPYQFDWHMARLEGGLHSLKINFNTSRLHADARLLLQKNRVKNGMLRIQVTRGSGSRGYLPVPDAGGPTCILETAPLPAPPETPVSLWLSSYAKISPHALPVQYKLCQGVNSTLARMEAAENNCFDALLLNEQGQVCETSSGSIFWVKDGTLCTPALSCGILDGSTRAALLRLYPTPVYEADAGLEVLTQADSVFIANAAWGIVAVNHLSPQEMAWDSAAAALHMNELLARDREDYTSQHRSEW